MGLKKFKDFSAAEVGMWLTAQDLGDHAPAFLKEGVDGDLLLALTVDDLMSDLGLSSLQSKKVMRNIEFTQNLSADAAPGGGGGEEAAMLHEKVEALSRENEGLMEKINALEDALRAKDEDVAALEKQLAEARERGMAVAVAEPEPAAPVYQPAPTPAPAPPPQAKGYPAQRRQPGVVGGAAIGATGGAARGAIMGAILPGMDASDGAKAGAAVGALQGGVGGLRGRRRRF